jgi:hypothetical protein
MREVIAFGGVARFQVPQTWDEEEDEDGEILCCYDPDGETALRLSIVRVDIKSGETPSVQWSRRQAGERQIDRARLTNGLEIDVYERDSVENGKAIRQRWWHLVQVMPGLERNFLFSYTYPPHSEDDLTDELTKLDREIRRMIPYPWPSWHEPS